MMMRLSHFCSPDFSLVTCSFEKDLCGWVQGASEDLDWERWNGSTEIPNTGPLGDHTSGNGEPATISTLSVSDKSSSMS